MLPRAKVKPWKLNSLPTGDVISWAVWVVMPVYATNDHALRITLEAVRSVVSERHRPELYLVINRLPIPAEEFKEQVREAARCDVGFLDTPQPSVAASWNAGLRAGMDLGFPFLLVLNSDAILEPKCLDELVAYGLGNYSIPLWTGQDTSGRPTAEADFSCFMLRPGTIEYHGWFDERFVPAYREDSDYFARITLSGQECRIAGRARFYHHGQTALPPEQVREYMEKNGCVYKEKWGTDSIHHLKANVFATHGGATCYGVTTTSWGHGPSIL